MERGDACLNFPKAHPGTWHVAQGNWHSSVLTYSQVGSWFLMRVCRQLRIPCPTERVFWPNMCLGTLLFLLVALLSLDRDCSGQSEGTM